MLLFFSRMIAGQARIRFRASTQVCASAAERYRVLAVTPCALLVLLLGMLSPVVRAQQQVTSSVSGTVQDSEKYAIGSAVVTIVSQDSGVQHTAKTNPEGEFRFSNLELGAYTLTVAVPGFETFKRTGIALSSNEDVTLPNINLKLGNATQTITVNSDTEALDTTSPNETTTLDTKTIDEVSTRSGDVMELLAILPGAIDTQAGQHDVPARNTVGSYEIDGQLTTNGHVNINVDGVSNLAAGNPGYLQGVPSPAMVKEIKITTSNYTSDTGGQGGPTLSIITRGGSKELHGSFDFPFRTQSLNANNPDNKKIYPALPRAPYSLLLPGATIAGPIVIPHLISRRASLFFFVGFQYQHQVTSNTSPTQVTVPTALERAGNFTNSVSNVGTPIVLANVCLSAVNVICPSAINPMLQKAIDLLPLPNTISTTVCTGGSSPCGYNYSWDPTDDNNRLTISGNIDWEPSNRPYSVSFRYLFEHDYIIGQTGSILSANTVPLGEFSNHGHSHAVSIAIRNTISPTIVNAFVAGLNYYIAHAGPLDPNYETIAGTGINLPELYPNAPNFGLLPNFTYAGSNVAGTTTLGQDYRNPEIAAQANLNFTDNLSKVFPRQTVTAGLSMAIQQVDGNQQINTRGAYDFSQNSSNAYDTGDTFANGLIGVLNAYTQAPTRVQSYMRVYDLEYFVQDVWKARPNLTLTMGNRFYQHPEPYEKENKLYGFVPSLYSQAAAPRLYTPISAAQVADPLNPTNVLSSSFAGFYVPNSGDLLDGVVQAGKNGVPRSIETTRPLVFSPRAGFAYSPLLNNKTVIRGGGGLYYSRASFNALNFTNSPPNQGTATLQYLRVSDVAADSGTKLTAPSASNLLPARQQPHWTVYNYSIGVTHQFGRSFEGTVSYVGSQSRHTDLNQNINPIPIGSRFNPAYRDIRTTSKFAVLPDYFFSKYVGFNSLTQPNFSGASNYNSLQAQGRENIRSARLTMLESFTWSHALGRSSISSYSPPPLPYYGPVSSGSPLLGTFTFIYYLPEPGRALHLKWLRPITDGWELSGILQAGTPPYVGVGYTIQNAYIYYSDGYEQLNSIAPSGSSDAARVEVVNSGGSRSQGKYAAPELGTFGDVAPGSERGTPVLVDSMSVIRNWVVHEKYRCSGRVEAFNPTNTEAPTSNDPNLTFSQPGSAFNLDPNSFTTNEQTANHLRGRVLQLDFKFQF
jgi:hypothetical protein